MSITIKALTPDLINDYFDFFDNRAFSYNSPFYPCYCNAFNMSLEQIKTQLFARSELYGKGTEGWRKVLRESAWEMVKSGIIHGYLAYDDDLAVGWCNANDRMNYYRVGEFDMDNIPEDVPPFSCSERGDVKSVVCFEISPEYRGRGIAGMLLTQVCKDAADEGYSFVEAYPKDKLEDDSPAFTGPLRLYEKFGFKEYARIGSDIIMRKALK
ncbi:MAG: GNAT family N-acetyltransferase [Ruminococcus sp.]|nr:GNAT family N-acetyltransferase [Ruminococcus sp.]